MSNGRLLWGDFTLSQGFSSHDNAYTGPTLGDSEGQFGRRTEAHLVEFQSPGDSYITLPSNHTLPLVPIYDTVASANSTSFCISTLHSLITAF